MYNNTSHEKGNIRSDCCHHAITNLAYQLSGAEWGTGVLHGLQNRL